jgi:hypothetical protein
MWGTRCCVLCALVLCVLAGEGFGQTGVVPPVPPGAILLPPVPLISTVPEVLSPFLANDFHAVVTATVARFQAVYVAQGSPRLAIFWNREVGERPLRGTSVTDRKTGDPREMAEGTAVGQPSAFRGRGQRASPGEVWEWEFEGGFLNPLLRAGARIVDRIGPLVDVEGRSNDKSRSDGPRAERLRDVADVVIEVLFSPTPESVTGGEVRVVVIDVASRLVVAYVDSRSVASGVAVTRSYIANERGFEPLAKVPSLRNLATLLAVDVMDALASRWAR